METIAQSRRRLTVRALSNLGSKLLGTMMGVGVAAVLARSLGPSRYGTFMLGVTLVATATALIDGGPSQVAVRNMAARPDQTSEQLSGLVIFRLLGGTLSMILLWLVILLVEPSPLRRIVLLLMVSSLPLMALTAFESLAKARLRPEVSARIAFLQSAMWLAVVLVLGAVGASLVGFAVAYLAAAAATAGGTYLLTRRLATIRFDGSQRRARLLLKESWILSLAGLFVTAYYRVDGVMLYAFAGPARSAAFSAAYRLVDVLQVVPATLVAVVLPLVARDMESERMRRTESLSLAIIVAGLAPFVVGGALVARPLVSLLYSSEYSDSADLLRILLPALLPIGTCYVLTSILIVRNAMKTYSWIVAIGASLNLAANLFLIPHFGAAAAASTTLATELLVAVLIGSTAVRRFSVRLPWREWFGTFLACVVMAAGVFATKSLGMVVQITVGGVLYVVFLLPCGGLKKSDVGHLLSRTPVPN